jgi:large subunit ribosomal protein L3
MKALIGTKIGMTQLFDENGNVARVTLLQAGPCVVTQVKTTDKDGYQAVQLGFGKGKNPAQPQVGHAKAAATTPRVMREVRLTDTVGNELKPGDQLDVTAFEAGDMVQVTGTSKGKGFAGTIKRHNFARGPKTHGSHNYRAHGSIGSGYPEHVFKGLRMAGHMGHDRVTVKGLKVVAVDQAHNVLAISGAIPGPKRGLVIVKAQEIK